MDKLIFLYGLMTGVAVSFVFAFLAMCVTIVKVDHKAVEEEKTQNKQVIQ